MSCMRLDRKNDWYSKYVPKGLLGNMRVIKRTGGSWYLHVTSAGNRSSVKHIQLPGDPFSAKLSITCVEVPLHLPKPVWKKRRIGDVFYVHNVLNILYALQMKESSAAHAFEISCSASHCLLRKIAMCMQRQIDEDTEMHSLSLSLQCVAISYNASFSLAPTSAISMQ